MEARSFMTLLLMVVFRLWRRYNNIDPRIKDRANKDNQTPLMIASNSEHTACVKWLLDHDADINIKSRVSGKTALDFARNKENKKMIKKK